MPIRKRHEPSTYPWMLDGGIHLQGAAVRKLHISVSQVFCGEVILAEVFTKTNENYGHGCAMETSDPLKTARFL